MDVDWDQYRKSYRYRLRVSLHYLDRQSASLKQRFIDAAKWCVVRNTAILTAFFVPLWWFSASAGVYGLASVAVGAIVLAWTAFRVHEKAFREAALVPDGRVGDTPYQERVSMTAMNYVDAAMGVLLVAAGFSVRIAATLGLF